MHDLISRQAAIKAICEDGTWLESQGCTEITMAERKQRDADILGELPSAQSEISRIEQELHGKTPEEQYEFLYWLLLKFGLAYTDSRLAVIEWLRGEKEDG